MNIKTLYQLKDPEEVALELADKVRLFRLGRKWKQATLADRSGVSLASLRRFEQTGLVSLQSLLKLSFALGCLSDFDTVLNSPKVDSIRELEALSVRPKVKRGSK